MEGHARNETFLALPLLCDKNNWGSSGANNFGLSSENLAQRNASTSFIKTCFNVINALSGIAMISIPYAISRGGWLSLTLLFATALIAFFSALLIKRCMDFDSNITTYPEIGELAFGKKGRTLVSIFSYLELYLLSIGFLILEGDNLHNLFPGFWIEIAGLEIGGKECFVLIVALVILPTIWLDSLSILSYVSAGGVLSSAIILGSIIWTGAFDESIGFKQEGVLINWKGIPTSISLYFICYCAHPLFPTFYSSMEDKRQFSNVMIICFTICTIYYTLLGMFGYLMFGSEAQTQITLNLPTAKLSSKVAVYTVLAIPIAKYALYVTPIINALKNSFLTNDYKLNKRVFGILISTSLVISTVIIAIFVPFFGSIVSLVGAFTSVTVVIIFPCLCYLKISGTYRRFGFEMISLMGIMLMGVIGGILGTYIAMAEIIESLQKL